MAPADLSIQRQCEPIAVRTAAYFLLIILWRYHLTNIDNAGLRCPRSGNRDGRAVARRTQSDRANRRKNDKSETRPRNPGSLPALWVENGVTGKVDYGGTKRATPSPFGTRASVPSSYGPGALCGTLQGTSWPVGRNAEGRSGAGRGARLLPQANRTGVSLRRGGARRGPCWGAWLTRRQLRRTLDAASRFPSDRGKCPQTGWIKVSNAVGSRPWPPYFQITYRPSPSRFGSIWFQ